MQAAIISPSDGTQAIWKWFVCVCAIFDKRQEMEKYAEPYYKQ